MNALNKSLTFTVPLSFEAHGLAERFRRQQSSPQKAKQVYLNTLAVYAVDFYLRCLGIETEVEKSDSRNPLYLKFMNVADLQVQSIGKLECCPVLPDSTVMQIPVEAREGRVGYIAVQFDRSLKQATLLGFTTTAVAELPLTELRAIADFPKHLADIRDKSPIFVNLRQWLASLKESLPSLEPPLNPYELKTNIHMAGNFFEQGWQELKELLSPEDLAPAYSYRSAEDSISDTGATNNLIQRGKKICLATRLTEQTILLLLKLKPESERDTNIIVEVRPQNGQLYLPEMLQVRILDERQTPVMQATASSSNQNLQFDFNAERGECFGVQMILGETSVTEEFSI